MATLLIFLWLVVGLYYSSPSPVPIQIPKQNEIKPESELKVWLWDVIPISWTDAAWIKSGISI